MTDPISDLITRVRNASNQKHEKVEAPASRIKASIAKVLKDEGYIKNFRLVREGNKTLMRIYLKYTDKGESVISDIKRVSKPGLRRYVGYREIPVVLNGAGIVIVSTPKGIMTGAQAKKQLVGGEVVCTVW